MRAMRVLLVGVVCTGIGVTMLTASQDAAAADNSYTTWQTDYQSAQQEARRRHLPMLVHFYADWCLPCQIMERNVLNTSEVAEWFGSEFIAVKINSDHAPNLVQQFNVQSLPADVFLDLNGEVLSHQSGAKSVQDYVAAMHNNYSRVAEERRAILAREKPPVIAENHNAGNTPPVAQTGSAQMIGLEGFSPVTLWRARKWTKGKKEFAVDFQGILFKLTSVEEKELFESDPWHYSPQLLGCDPVVLHDTDRAVTGSIQYAAYYDDELYLFRNDENRQRFKQNPALFTRTRHVLQTDQIEGTRWR